MTKIEFDLRLYPKILKNSNAPYYFSSIEAIIINPHSNVKTPLTKRFIFDTGASITILNSSFNFMFKDDTPIIDSVTIRYGGSIVNLPVYNVILKIKGNEIKIPAAFDKNMKLDSLLGHFGFLNELEHFGISKKRRKLIIIK